MTAFEYSIRVEDHKKLVSLMRELSEIGVRFIYGENGGSVTDVYKIGKYDVIINHSSTRDNRVKNYHFNVAPYHEPKPNSKLSNWLKKHKAKPKHADSLP
jgi:hypothetical protein